jgi:hypothetical protein
MLVVKDDFFNADLTELLAKGTELYPWKYHHKSDIDDPTHNKFFVSTLWTHPIFLKGGEKQSQDNFFYMLWKFIHKNIPSLSRQYCWRIIANGQVKGQDGNWHTDHGDKTLLYFPLEWNLEWGGSTYLRIDDSITEIRYNRNRLVIFDSNIPHYGSAPTVANILRVSIAFNLLTR